MYRPDWQTAMDFETDPARDFAEADFPASLSPSSIKSSQQRIAKRDAAAQHGLLVHTVETRPPDGLRHTTSASSFRAQKSTAHNRGIVLSLPRMCGNTTLRRLAYDLIASNAREKDPKQDGFLSNTTIFISDRRPSSSKSYRRVHRYWSGA